MSGKRELIHNMIAASNMERFLDYTTPAVPAMPLKKEWEESRVWESLEEIPTQFFRLGDLWKCYDEWSAYGAAVPVLVSGGRERLVQYFVPYLSALQIYTTRPHNHKTLLSDPIRDPRNGGDFSDSETSRADEMSDSEFSRSLSRSSSEKSESWDSGSDGSTGEQESGWCRPRDRLGHLYLEYFEHAPPYARVPLMEKINQLSQAYTELNSLRSIDLSPASWMAVAWYPIYHIPASRTVRDLAASFLTYHTLSFSFQDSGDGSSSDATSSSSPPSSSIRLPPFGIATYKLKGEVWLSGGGWDQHRLYSLWTSALSWLAQLQLNHPDFRFFLSHRD